MTRTKPTDEALPSIRCTRAKSIVNRDGSMDSLQWLLADSVPLQLNAGGRPSCDTSVRTLYDEECLYIGFACEDPDPSAQMTQRNDPIFREGNVVEVFITPEEKGVRFYEFEVNPLNTLLDLYYENRDVPWKEASRWEAAGIRTAVSLTRDSSSNSLPGWKVQLAIPWSNFHIADRLPPNPGDIWRINFYRYNTLATTEGSRVELSAWSRTLEDRFDVLERFGFIHF